MQKFITICLLFFCSINLASAQTKQPANQISSAGKCLAPWLDGLDQIIARDSIDQDPRAYRSILANGAIGQPVAQGHVLGLKWISGPKDRTKGTVGIVPICSTVGLPAPWIKELQSRQFVASYYPRPFDAVVLRGYLPVPNILRGFILLHEMRHGLQERYATSNPGEPIVLIKEVDAYDFEFSVLDHSSLPGYQAMLEDEIKRIKVDFARTGSTRPNAADPRLDQIFPGLGKNQVARNIAATEIMIRAVFKLYERENLPETAFRKKLSFMSALGYR
jgi:hypothetical protein